MIITFEGPDCSGKTTQAKSLVEYINKYYPKLHAIYKHFPNHDRKDIQLILHDKDANISNPYYIASSYMNEFFYEFNSSEKYTTVDNKVTLTLKEAARRKDVILVLDRYYYSSLIMCPHWPNKYDNIKDMTSEQRTQKNEYIKNLFGVTGLLLQKFELPRPDLTIVLIPDKDDMIKRISEKTSVKDSDKFETIKKAEEFYYDYLDSVIDGDASLYHMNGEWFNPVVINNRKTTYIPTSKKTNNMDTILQDYCSNILGNTKNVTKTKLMVEGVFESYLKTICEITNNNEEKAIYIFKVSKKDLDIYESCYDDPKDKEETKEEDHFTGLVNPVKEYDLSKKEEVAFCKIGHPTPYNVINSPDKYILSKQYPTNERVMVLNILLKILRADYTKDQFPSAKIDEVTRYIYRKIEQLHAGSVVSTEGGKVEDTREDKEDNSGDQPVEGAKAAEGSKKEE